MDYTFKMPDGTEKQVPGMIIPGMGFVYDDRKLTEENIDIKRDLTTIDDVLSDGSTTRTMTWEIGSFNTTTGEKLGTNSSVRCLTFLKVYPSTTIINNTGSYRVRIFEYGSNSVDSFLRYRDLSVSTGKHTLGKGDENCAYIRLAVVSNGGNCDDGANVSVVWDMKIYTDVQTLNVDVQTLKADVQTLKADKYTLLPLEKSTVVFVDDDGLSSVLTTTIPIMNNANLPLNIALSSASDISSDITVLNDLVSDGHCLVQHAIGTDQDLDTKSYADLKSWIAQEKGYWYDNGLCIKNMVYCGTKWSENLARVISEEYDSGCTIYGVSGGHNGYNVPNSDSKFKLIRNKVTNDTNTLSKLQGFIDTMVSANNGGLLIFYWHSSELEASTEYTEKLTSLLSYVNTLVESGSIVVSTLDKLFS